MSNIKKAFKDSKALIGFVTAGDPNIETSEQIILSMAEAGCDLIEIGIPFSDPIAEGPVIQAANVRSLSQGTTTDKIFELTKRVSAQTDTPLVYMTYLNVLFRYDYDKFMQKASESGVSGVIIPDMPFEEKSELKSSAEKYNIDIVSIIAPAEKDRIKTIASEAEGFIYAIPAIGTADADKIFANLKSMTNAVRDVSNIPVAVIADIENPEQAAKYINIADGVIVGSAIVKIIEEHKSHAPDKIHEYIKSLKDAIK